MVSDFRVTLSSARRLRPIVIATSLVSCLEIFGFTVFALFAGWIGGQFFPATDPMVSLLLAVSTFGVGFLFRPLGALLIGAYADRVGRRAALSLSIWLMVAGMVTVAACPPYSVMGLMAPVTILVGRLLQGLAAGGEIGAAAAYVMEAGPVSRRGYLLSWQLVSQAGAVLIGALLGALLSRSLSAESLATWGWRIPFVIGLLIAPLGWYVRRRLPEDAVRATSAGRHRVPLVELCGKHGKTLALATLTIAVRTVPAYTISYFMPTYLTHVMHLPAVTGFLASAVSALVLMLVAPLAGRLADRLPRRKPLLLLASGMTTLLVYPVFHVLTHAPDTVTVLAAVALMSVFVAPCSGVGTVLVLEALPAQVRASGVAVSFALGVAVFGGTAQPIVTSLIKWTGDPMAVAWYVAPACLVSFCALLFFPERRRQLELTPETSVR
ncbi:MFS transporter [Paraburkholderia monticola]|uniref:MFS transporter n=1 Tax=Paraburkholderia monticola TaxID=1399968 RepID=A0A149PDV7_9BURK|nr:MFS transporter [Paraburkholderia monticola]KXU83210.1 MFS transporter [Paraburkholderia monticola]